MYTLEQVLSIRRSYDLPLWVEETRSSSGTLIGYKAEVELKHRVVDCFVTVGSPEAAALISIQSLWNVPIDKAPYTDEFRFTTHDFTDPATWDGRTNGDPAATWAAANGGVTYDDVNYRWLDSNGDPVCYLSGANANDPPEDDGIGNVWRDSSDDSVVVEFNDQTDHWERTDTNANVTSSRWSIVPYPNYKMQIIMANAVWGTDSVVNGTLRYTVYMYLTSQQAQAASGNPNAPAGVYPVKQFAYPSADLLKMSADKREVVGQDVEAIYDYRTTVEPVIDSLAQMRLELTLDNHAPITSASNRKGRAVFIGKKIVSF